MVDHGEFMYDQATDLIERLEEENEQLKDYIEVLESKLAKNGIRIEPKDFD